MWTSESHLFLMIFVFAYLTEGVQPCSVLHRLIWSANMADKKASIVKKSSVRLSKITSAGTHLFFHFKYWRLLLYILVTSTAPSTLNDFKVKEVRRSFCLNVVFSWTCFNTFSMKFMMHCSSILERPFQESRIISTWLLVEAALVLMVHKHYWNSSSIRLAMPLLMYFKCNWDFEILICGFILSCSCGACAIDTWGMVWPQWGGTSCCTVLNHVDYHFIANPSTKAKLFMKFGIGFQLWACMLLQSLALKAAASSVCLRISFWRLGSWKCNFPYGVLLVLTWIITFVCPSKVLSSGRSMYFHSCIAGSLFVGCLFWKMGTSHWMRITYSLTNQEACRKKH